MIEQSYRREIIASTTPQEAYKVLTLGFKKWWTASSDSIMKEGDMTTFRFPPNPTYWTFRTNVLEQDTYVELECTEARHIQDGLPDSILKEWEGTKLIWSIDPCEGGVKIAFTHEGLTPSLDCYEICEGGWDHFFMNSLKNYLDGNAGAPHQHAQTQEE